MTYKIKEEYISLANLNIILTFDKLFTKPSEEIVSDLKNNNIVEKTIIPTIIPIPEWVNDIPMIYLNNWRESINISKATFQYAINFDIPEKNKEIPNFDNLVNKLIKIFDYLSINNININRVAFLSTYFIETTEWAKLVSENFLKNVDNDLIDLNIRVANSKIIDNRLFNNSKTYNLWEVNMNWLVKKWIIWTIDINSRIQDMNTNIHKNKYENIIKSISSYLDYKNIIF